MRAGYGYDKHRINIAVYEQGQGVTGSVWQKGDSVKYGKYGMSEIGGWKGQHDDRINTAGWVSNSLLGVPLTINNETLGLIRVENKKVSGNYVDYTDEDMETLKIFVNAISDAIQSSYNILPILGKWYVFVLMPFQKKFKNIYEIGIKSAVEKAGMRCEKADEIEFNDDILRKIYDCILRADIVVSIMTDNNPNVFYETGYSHALGKFTIHLSELGGKIPFDLSHYNHIIYDPEDITDLSLKLEKRLIAVKRDLRKTYKHGKT